jgi:multidrug efflux pump subunit AcrB
MGHDVSMFSLIGLVALSGVVVNDSLVLVDYVNKRRAEGEELCAALVSAGTARFRAILLTSLTTFAGLTPLMLERGVQAQMLIPMGISLAFGVIFATLITLLLIPAGYLILEDVLQSFARSLPSNYSESLLEESDPTSSAWTSRSEEPVADRS